MNYFCISSICLIDSLTATSHCIFGPQVIAVWQMQFFSIWNLSRLRSIVDPVLRQPKKVAKLDRCDCRWAHAIFFIWNLSCSRSIVGPVLKNPKKMQLNWIGEHPCGLWS